MADAEETAVPQPVEEATIEQPQETTSTVGGDEGEAEQNVEEAGEDTNGAEYGATEEPTHGEEEGESLTSGDGSVTEILHSGITTHSEEVDEEALQSLANEEKETQDNEVDANEAVASEDTEAKEAENDETERGDADLEDSEKPDAEMDDAEKADDGEDAERDEDEEGEKNVEKEDSGDEDKPVDEKEELTKEIFGDSDEDDTFDVPEPVDYKESDEEDDDHVEPTKKLKRLAKNSKRKKKADSDDEDAPAPEEKTKKKRKKKDDSGTASPKKRKKEKKEKKAESGDDSDGGGATNYNKDAGEVPELDAALERIKKKRAKALTPEQCAPIVQAMLDKMEDAAAKDSKANAAKQPAIQKIRILSEVCETLNKKPFYRKFLDLDGLKAVRKWLEPMPDGSLPNIKIREQLLTAISKMPIETTDLQTSLVGKVVMFLMNHKDESRENKRLCQNMIEKWSRPIFHLHTTYDANYEGETRREKGSMRPEKEESELDRMTREQIKDTRKHHAHIPRRMIMDFNIRPNPEIHLQSETKQVKNPHLMAHAADKKIRSKLTKGRNPVGQKVMRAERMSIEGRGYK